MILTSRLDPEVRAFMIRGLMSARKIKIKSADSTDRHRLFHSTSPDKVSRVLAGIIPEKHLLHAHPYLLLHGRHTCRARAPLCQSCCLRDLCTSPDRHLPET